MGTFSVDIEIGSPDGSRYEVVEALVDTGASFSMVPRGMLERLGVTAHDQIPFILADGSRILRDIGWTRIRVNEKSEPSLVVFGETEAETLLGSHTLQGLLLAVDTPNERLVSVPGMLK